MADETGTPPPFEALTVERDNGVVTVTLSRPEKKNAMNAVMFRELRAVLEEVADRAQDRVLVITGAGNEFCAGADLTDTEGDDIHPMTRGRSVAAVALALHHLPKPSIAKVRGVAVGAGCNLALGCDLIVADDTARFAEIFVKRGLSVDFGGTWLLPRLVGIHKARELAYFGDVITAHEARELGLVNRVVDPAELDSLVGEWASRLAGSPPLALAMTKAMLANSSRLSMDQALDDEVRSQAVNLSTHDTHEAIAAFVERREPRFLGR